MEQLNKTCVKVENLTKSFDGKYILSDINFTVYKGEFICIVGSSGCGKSTLLRSISGLDTEYESGPPENEAFAARLVDIGVMGNVPALSGIASGQKRKIVGIAYNGEATEAIIVPKDSEIKNVSDLKGKKIGLVVGSIAQNLVSEVFNSNGLKFSDVEFVNLSAGEQQNF